MKRLQKWALLLALTLVPAMAAGGERDGQRWMLRASGDIRSIERSGDSLWVGTSGGIFIYDLLREALVDTITLPVLPSNSVRALRAAGDTLYAGTDAGLAIFDTSGVRLLTPAHNAGHDSIPLDMIRSIDLGLDGTIYLGTYGGGVGAIKGDSSWAFTSEDSLLDNKVYGMFQQDDTTFYYATSMGLCAWRDSAWVGFQAGAGIPRGEVRRIVPLQGDLMLLLVGEGGVYRFDGRSARRLYRGGIFPEDAIGDIALDAQGNLWAAGRFGGVARYRGGTWTSIAEGDDNVWRRQWRCARAGPEGEVFFGSADGKILALMDGDLRWIDLPSGLPSGEVRAFREDTDGTVFFLNGGRLARIDPGGDRPVFEPFAERAADIAVAPSGGVWVAGRFGIFRRVRGGYEPFSVDVRERDPAFEAIAFDELGALWVAARDGAVYRYDGIAWIRLADPGELPAAQQLVARAGGGVWTVTLAPSPPALARYRQGGWARFGADILGDSPVVDATRSGDGAILVARPQEVRRFAPSGGEWLAVLAGDGDAPGGPVVPPAGARFSCVAADARGGIYLGCSEWVAYIGAGAPRWVRTGEAFHAAGLSELFVDASGALWAGFERDGMARAPRESVWSP